MFPRRHDEEVSGKRGRSHSCSARAVLSADSEGSGTVAVQYGTAVLGFDTVVSSAGTLAVGSGATLGGVGFVTGAIGGAGLLSPGNSPGILTAGSLDPSGGTGLVLPGFPWLEPASSRDATIR